MHTDTHIDVHTDTHKYTCTHTDTHTDIQIHTDTDIDTSRDESAIVTVIKVGEMIQRIIDHKTKLHKVKVGTSNFQKNDDMIITSESSTIELDYEVF